MGQVRVEDQRVEEAISCVSEVGHVVVGQTEVYDSPDVVGSQVQSLLVGCYASRGVQVLGQSSPVFVP